MELLGLLGFLVCLLYTIGLPVVLIAVLVRLGHLREKIDDINRRLAAKSGLPAKAAPADTPKPPASVAPVPAASPVSSAAPVAPVKAEPPAAPVAPVERVARPKPSLPEELTAMDLFWSRIEDWFCVRGDFAPKGMSREFAVATRWLVRVGAVLLVGASAYFLMLAIDRGWIGPAQRVYGMMAWGVIGASAGTGMRLKKADYALLGEVVAALGLVALYLAFGLGHRYFEPPVIASCAGTFAGLVAASVAAAVLSVRLRSLTIAVLGLAGGLLVPLITRFAAQPVKTDVYLLLLVGAATVIAHLRRWTALGFAAAAASFAVFACQHTRGGALVAGLFLTGLYVAVVALALVDAPHRSRAGRNLSWAFVALAAVVWFVAMARDCFWPIGELRTAAVLAGVAVAHGALAGFCKGRDRVAAVLFNVLAVACAAFALASFLDDLRAWILPAFCLFSALLAELDVRTDDRTFGVLALAVLVPCALYTVFGAFPLAYGGMTAARYTAEFGVRLVRLASLPALLAFLACRLGREGGLVSAVRWRFVWSAAAMVFAFISLESHFAGRFLLPVLGGGLVTLVWASAGAALLTAGIVRRGRGARLAGLALLALAVLKILFRDTSSLATPARVAVFAAVGALLIAGAFLYLRFKNAFEEVPATPVPAEKR